MITSSITVSKYFLKFLKRDNVTWLEAIASNSRWRREINEKNTESFGSNHN